MPVKWLKCCPIGMGMDTTKMTMYIFQNLLRVIDKVTIERVLGQVINLVDRVNIANPLVTPINKMIKSQ